MQQRVSLITLGVADLDAARAFYRRLGWRGQEVEETVFFQIGGLGLILWAWHKLAADAGRAPLAGSQASGGVPNLPEFGGITLAHNVTSPGEVDEILAAARSAGGQITALAAPTFYGGYAGYFADLDGHAWEIAYNPGFPIGPGGTITIPDFGADAP